MRLLVAFTLVSAVIAIPIPQPGPQSSSDPPSTPNAQPTPETQPTPESEESWPPESSGVRPWNGGGNGDPTDEDLPEGNTGFTHNWSFKDYDWGQAATDTLNTGKTILGAGAAATGLKTLWDIYSLEGAAAWHLLKPSVGGDRGISGGL
ncbi:hypothetical protein MMC22_000546 [Lobaria immixta]|nr:hypothetical protein [Lobaria immixta]